MLRLAVATALVALPALAAAQTGEPPKKVRSIGLSKGQACPKAATSDEVIVCYPLGETYRIPKELRDDPIPTAANQSWVNRAAQVDQVSRVAGGLPDTCSAVGTGGQSGCALATAQEYAAERRERAQEDGSGSQPQ